MTDFSRLDELTRMRTRAVDRERSLHPKDREERARVGEISSRVMAERGEEISRLSDGGRDRAALSRIGEHLDRTDPYRYGVPENRPVRQRAAAPGRTRRTR